MTPGQVAYEAYSAAVGGASAVTGTVLPSWAGTTPIIREAWEVAADAVRRMGQGIGPAYGDGNPGGGDPILLPPNTPQPG